MIRLDVAARELSLVEKIMQRARKSGLAHDHILTVKDILSAKCNEKSIDLAKMLNSDNFSFAHDFTGITFYFDRKAGRFRDCFLPLCGRSHEPDIKVT